ncbi:23409_t:CDS:2, partial [Entrophospora sp. SA101]
MSDMSDMVRVINADIVDNFDTIIIPQQNNQVQFNAARFITHPTQENYINTEWYINGVAMELSVDTNIS